MKSEIAKEREKKKLTKTYLIVFAVVYILFVLIVLHTSAIMRDDPRAGLMESLNPALVNIILHPLKIFPISGGSLTWIFAGTMSIGCVAFVMKENKELMAHDDPNTVKGEAHWMNSAELEEYNKKRTEPFRENTSNGKNNMILSEDIKLSLDGFTSKRNCNVLAIGGSGAGKTRFFAAPNILQYNSNFVITDPSGELLRDYGKGLQDNGYEVLVFNITNPNKSNRYNPFHYIKEEKDVFTLVDTLIKNTTPPKSSSNDPFWEKSEKLLMQSLVLLLWHFGESEFLKLDQTFSNVVNLVNLAVVDENDTSIQSPLDKLFLEAEALDGPNNLAVKQYKSFKLAAGNTLKSILISVAVRLEKFQLADIEYLTAVDEFHFETFSDTKKALFVIIPTGETTFNFLVSLMYSQLFMSLYRYKELYTMYGWQALAGKDVIKVEQAKNEEDSKRAEKRLKSFIAAAAKNGTEIKFDKENRLYKVYVKRKGKNGKFKLELAGWRGKKEDAEKFAESLKKMTAYRPKPDYASCPNHVRFILDEFANIGQIPEFSEKLATIRKYNLSCSIIIQNIAQLKKMYQDDCDTIIGNCDTKLFLGSDDTETLKWLVEQLGKKTTRVQSVSLQGNQSSSSSVNRDSLELITIDQAAIMDEKDCIVKIRGERPYFGRKYDLIKHPNYNYAHEMAGKFEIKSRGKVLDPIIPFKDRDHKKESNAVNSMIAMAEGNISPTPATSGENLSESEKKNIEKIAKRTDKVEKPDNKKLRTTVNNARNNAGKLTAERAKKAAQKDTSELNASPEFEEALGLALAEAYHVKPTDSDETIKEKIESVICLNARPTVDPVYGMTGDDE